MKIKKNKPQINISISPEINEKLNEEGYNKSKLIDKLLTEYFKKKDNKK